MAKQKRAEPSPPNSGLLGSRELIVIAKHDAGIRAHPTGVSSIHAVDYSSLEKLLSDNEVTMTPLFGMSEDSLLKEIMAQSPSAVEEDIKMHLFYQVDAPDEQLDNLCEKFLQNELIEGAYVRPTPELPVLNEIYEHTAEPLIQTAPIPETPATPPLLESRQGYLNAAPEGVDARYAWTLSGGRGNCVRIIDIEGGWRFTHMDLRQNQGGVLAGSNSLNDHGTAVLGEYSSDRNSFGITGICDLAWAGAVSHSIGVARAIMTAADKLRAGDIMLLEMHAPGPRYNYQSRADQLGYIAMEWWPDIYLAVRYATDKGVIVVSAAGNGAENLLDSQYDKKPPGFPSWWRNPFRRNPLDSGSILVGAGAPPPGTHGRTIHGPDRSRLAFSNYGSCVDAQGWGREVTTSGYGDLWTDPDDRNNQDRRYTDVFSGTSSASPIVVGAIGCLQGYLISRYQRNLSSLPLGPRSARQLLRNTGSPQQSAPGRPRTQRIGNRPNLRQMIGTAPRPQLVRLGSEIDQCSSTLYVRDRDNRIVRIPRGQWKWVLVAIDSNGYWRWRCGTSWERSRGVSSFRNRVKLLHVYHSNTSRQITWWCYDIR
ncbi:MAG: S8 family serine peptidase [Saprospiraceae bacterium]